MTTPEIQDLGTLLYEVRDRVAVVTGAAGGLGLSICERLQSICAQLATRDVATRCGDQRVTLSAGLAHWPEQGQALDELLQAADAALYQAKRDGGDRLCWPHDVVETG